MTINAGIEPRENDSKLPKNLLTVTESEDESGDQYEIRFTL